MRTQFKFLACMAFMAAPFAGAHAASKDNMYVHGWGSYNIYSASSDIGLLNNLSNTASSSAAVAGRTTTGSAFKGGPAFGFDLMWGQSNRDAAFKYGFGAAYIGLYKADITSTDGLYKFSGTLGMIPVTARFTFRQWGWFIWGAGLGFSMRQGSIDYLVAGQDRSSDIPKIGGSFLVIDIHLGINVFHTDTLAVNLEARSYTTVSNTVFMILPTLTVEYRF